MTERLLDAKFDHFEIISLLGSGGMGEVYLAKDTRLNRKIAIKVLSPERVQNAERRRRFTQEAQAASALNHPNIITIYEIGELNNNAYIAMEFVTGRTLNEEVRKGSPEVKDILSIFIQIAEALTVAHEAGIIHRDLKPDNVMVRVDGYIKILDFGLAKLTEQAPAEPVGSDIITQIKNATQPGTVMGTIAYMSPEQALAREVDARSDIFSFGTMLYEALTRQQPFRGNNSVDVLYAIIHHEPEPLPTENTIPAKLQDLIHKALMKDPAERYQTMKDLVVDLRRIKRELIANRTTTITNEITVTTLSMIRPTLANLSRRTLPYLPLIFLSVLLLLGGYLVGRYNNKGVVMRMPNYQSTQLTATPGLDCYPNFSPDGNSIAYASDRSGKFEIYVKQLTLGGREIAITNDGEQNFQPAWSPDGGRIAYYSRSRGGICVIPSLGGVPRQLSDFGSSPQWSPDGNTIYFQSDTIFDLSATAFPAMPPSTIWTISANGGEPQELTKRENPPGGHGSPSISPDGKWLVFLSYDLGYSAIWLLNLQTKELRQIAVKTATPYYFNPIFAPDSRSIYYTIAAGDVNFGLWQQPLSNQGQPDGEPREILNTVFMRIKHLAISKDGKRLAYNALTMTSNIWSIPISKQTAQAIGTPTALTNNTSFRNFNPAFSPDGEKVAWTSWNAGMLPDLWVIDADGKNPMQLTTDPALDSLPSWSNDGEQLFFISARPKATSLWSLSLKSGKEKSLVGPIENISQVKFSPDGQRFICQRLQGASLNLWMGDIATGNIKQFTFDKEFIGYPCWSPDGKMIAFELKRGDNDYVGIIASDGGEVVQLNKDDGHSWASSWAPDNDKIAFAGFRNGYWNIFWISRSTKEQQQVTKYAKPNAYVRYPEWSPKGDRIVYEYSETTGNIWVMELEDKK